MLIKAISLENGAEFQGNAESVDSKFIKFLNEFEFSEEGINRQIDKLNISADAKALLHSFTQATFVVGDYIIKIGRKIFEIIVAVCKEYPSASFGMIFGAIAGLLISSIPVIGWVLGPLLTPILIALGMIGGIMEDLKDKALMRRITEINAKFAPLNTGK